MFGLIALFVVIILIWPFKTKVSQLENPTVFIRFVGPMFGVSFLGIGVFEFLYGAAILQKASEDSPFNIDHFLGLILVVMMPIICLAGIWFIVGSLFLPNAIKSWVTTKYDTTLW